MESNMDVAVEVSEKPQFLESMSILMAVGAVAAVLLAYVGPFIGLNGVSGLGNALVAPFLALSLIFAVHHVAQIIVWHKRS